MRVVSLNLDAVDAAAIRRALAGAMTACACGDGADGRLCADCEAISAVVGDLDRLLARPAPRRRWPTLASGGSPPPELALAAGAGGAGQRGGSAPAVPAERRLWLVPSGLADGS